MSKDRKSPTLLEQQPGLKGFVKGYDAPIITAILPVLQAAIEGIALGLVLTLPVYWIAGVI